MGKHDHGKHNSKKKWGSKRGAFRSIFMHADGKDLVLMVLGFIGSVGDGMALPMRCFIVSRLLNDIGHSFTNTDPQLLHRNINKNAIILCYFAIASWFSCSLEGYCWTRTAERQAARMRARYLKAVLRQDVGYFDVHVTNISDVITSVSTDSLIIQDCISDKVPHFIMNMSLFIGSYLAALFLVWQLAVAGLPFLLFLVIPGLIYGRILMGIARKISSEYSKAGSIAEQAISSIRTIYAFVAETNTIAKFSEALEGSAELGIKQGLAKGLAIGSNGITFAIFGFYSWYGSRLVMYQGVQGGNLFVVGAATTIGGLASGIALSDLKYFSEATSAAERIMEVIQREPKIDSENLEGLTLENVKGEVEFKHVEFAYPARPGSIIFQDFSLHIPAGKTIALVGNSGSGKSTTVALLQRFYDPLGGEILLDGLPIDKLQLKWLRSQIGLVSQEPALFATSIKENILFGKEDATLKEVTEAATAANAHNFISQLPQGYDTQVGERGAQLSGGQKQRIAIARAIIKRPQILLLDEATSALDSESERIVQEALDKVAIGRTTIIIAHRLSTIQNADTIAFIKDGEVVEIGSHEELTQIEGGLYASLVKMQVGENSEDGNNVNTPSTLEASSNAILDINSKSNMSSRRLSTRTRSSSFSWINDLDTKPTNGDDKHQSIPNPSFWRLLLLNSPEWKQAVLGCLCAMLFGAIQPVYSFVMGSMINVYFLQDHDELKRRAMIYSLSFVGFFFFSLVVSTSQHYNSAYMGEQLTKRVREKMFSKILTFEIGWFDQDENSTGAICSRLAKDANMVRSLVGDRMSLLLQACSAVIISAAMCLVISWRFALIMLVAQPLIVLCFYMKRVLLKHMSQKAIEAQETSSKIAAEAVYNIRTITSFSSQDRILNMLKKAQEGPRQAGIKQSWYAAICLGASQSMTVFSFALCFGYGGWLLIHGYIKPQALFEIFLILSSTARVIAEAGSMTSDLSKGIDAVGSLFRVLDRPSQIEPADPEGYQPEKILGHVEVCDVDFAYPTRPTVMIFKDFSINIAAGKSTALVGQSGSGKSTIIGLVQRFYDPIKGTVKIDGRDIRSYCIRSLRKHLALVSQEPMLFAGTIRENIVYGASHSVDESEIIEAAKIANADGFISSLKDGYDTWCGDKGVQLSGGQKQRIAIARAVLRNPAILLLDEATSALDGHSEKLVQEALETIMVGRTSVVVAHRLITIQNCDEIAVLKKGKVVEKGTHSSLLNKGPRGAYYSLLSLQRKPNNKSEEKWNTTFPAS